MDDISLKIKFKNGSLPDLTPVCGMFFADVVVVKMDDISLKIKFKNGSLPDLTPVCGMR